MKTKEKRKRRREGESGSRRLCCVQGWASAQESAPFLRVGVGEPPSQLALGLCPSGQPAPSKLPRAQGDVSQHQKWSHCCLGTFGSGLLSVTPSVLLLEALQQGWLLHRLVPWQSTSLSRCSRLDRRGGARYGFDMLSRWISDVKHLSRTCWPSFEYVLCISIYVLCLFLNGIFFFFFCY